MGEVYRARDSRLGRDVALKNPPALDARLMAVTLTYRTASQIGPASPLALFRTCINGVTTGGSGIEYDLSSDGKRFLMNTLVEHSNSPITLLHSGAVNSLWRPDVTHPSDAGGIASQKRSDT